MVRVRLDPDVSEIVAAIIRLRAELGSPRNRDHTRTANDLIRVSGKQVIQDLKRQKETRR